MSHDEPRLQLHAYLKSLSGYRGAPLFDTFCDIFCDKINWDIIAILRYYRKKYRKIAIKIANFLLRKATPFVWV